MPVDCAAARAALQRALAARLERQGRRAIVERARTLARLSRAPADHVARHRTRLHQQLRELRAGARRGLAERERRPPRSAARWRRKRARRRREPPRRRRAPAPTPRRSTASPRRAASAAAATSSGCALALAAHDPQRTLERGYALVEDPAGEPVTSRRRGPRAARADAAPARRPRAVRPDPSGRPRYPE